MTTQARDTKLNTDNKPGNLMESLTKAQTAREVAYQEATRAREAAAKLAQEAKEMAREVKRKAKAAQIAALKAKIEEKKISKKLKNTKVIEVPATLKHETPKTEKTNENTLLNFAAEQLKANLVRKLEEGQNDITRKKTASEKGEPRTKTDETLNTSAGLSNVAAETKWLSGGLFEGRADILLRRVNPKQIDSLADQLRSIQNLKVEFVSGSDDGSSNIAILAEQPIPLLDFLNQIPEVDGVTQFGWRTVELTLKKE